MPTKVTINGMEIEGENISIIGGKLNVDGIEVKDWPLTERVKIVVVEGAIKSLRTDASVECGSVSGNVHAGGSVKCAGINGSASAGGSITAGSHLGGNISAGGSVRIG
jgi:hypothetical protein